MRQSSRTVFTNMTSLTGCEVDTAKKRGIVLPLAAVCMTVLIMFSALVVDLGVLFLAHTEAQNSVDAAALAAAGHLYPDPKPQTAVKLPLSLPIYQPTRPYPNITPALAASKTVGAANTCREASSLIILDSDISFGIYNNGITVGPPPTLNPVDGLLSLLQLRTADSTFVNCSHVVLRRDSLANQPLKLFFAPILGSTSPTIQVSASAAIERGYGLGPGDKMLPFALDITIWNALRFTNSEINAVTLKPVGVDLNSMTLSGLLGSTGLLNILNGVLPLALSGSPIHVLDGYTYKRGMTTVSPGPDGIVEAVLLADQLTVVNKLGILGIILSSVQRVPSLMMTLETGASSSGVPNAARLNNVIRNGLSASDLQVITGSSSGEMWLPFQTRGYFELPDECEADLKAIIGQPRILPLYATLPGTVNKVTDVLGMPHQVQIVGWGAVVITQVNLQGPLRYINVQPAIYARHTVLPAKGTKMSLPGNHMSDGIYTTPKLVK